VAEARLLVARSPVHGYVAGAHNPRPAFERVLRDGVLEPTELYACGHFLETVALIGRELRARAQEVPLWADDFARAPEAPPVCARITRSVSSEGAILDTASSELARLRRERAARRAEFETSLGNRIKDWNARGLLQDNFYDVIDGRYVVPVKVELQSKLEGSLLGRSQSGQSVFIEPTELMVSNNALKELELSIRAEEYRIRRELSQAIAAAAPAFDPWIEPIAELDLACAAGVLANDWELEAPETTGGALDALNVFHPGLKIRGAEIIKNSLSIAEGGRGLLISGPNTGGKTVLLKAVALATCMARAGLFVPAAKSSRIPHYADVLAFIGDDQNIAQGLSSFSAQVLDLKRVAESRAAPLLIVIDEMLSSTDPEEASALAQALIEEFVAAGHHVLVTSHFSELSLRCKLHPKMAVAAMEFEDGRPTYRLRPDELGSSHAIEVAERLGLPARVLERARGLLSSAKLDYERARTELKEREQELELEVERVRATAVRDRERVAHEAREKISAFMTEAREKIESTARELAARISPASGKRTVERAEGRLKELKQDIETGAKEAGPREDLESESAEPAPLVPGARVRVRSMNRAEGTILALSGEGVGAIATVQVGNFRLERPVDDLTAVAAPKKPAPGLHASYESGGNVSTKLDLRGLRLDEALAEAERYLDRALRSGAASVTVITGHGTGALKKGLRDLLKSLPYVRNQRPEREGDDGAIVVEF
jgi:DNA mismatch repair protein MutS2